MKKTINVYNGPMHVAWLPGNRDYQEDYFGVFGDENRLLLVIADGMGGHSHGGLASRWLVEELTQAFKIRKNNQDIFTQGIGNAVQKMKASEKDMGCTFIAAIIEKNSSGYKLSYTWIGDSRLYLVNTTPNGKPSDNARKIAREKNRNLWILTGDDTFVWRYYLNKEITIDQITQHPNKNQLEFSIHPGQENLGNIVEKRIRNVSLQEGDKLFFCTDGVWETYQSQANILKHVIGINRSTNVRTHLETVGKENSLDDNATFILAEIGKGIFNRQCSPGIKMKLKKKKFGSIIAVLFALIIFVLLFFTLTGKFDPLIKKMKRHLFRGQAVQQQENRH